MQSTGVGGERRCHLTTPPVQRLEGCQARDDRSASQQYAGDVTAPQSQRDAYTAQTLLHAAHSSTFHPAHLHSRERDAIHKASLTHKRLSSVPSSLLQQGVRLLLVGDVGRGEVVALGQVCRGDRRGEVEGGGVVLRVGGVADGRSVDGSGGGDAELQAVVVEERRGVDGVHSGRGRQQGVGVEALVGEGVGGG